MRHLHTNQHAAVIRAVVAVVEQADIPVMAHAVEEISSVHLAVPEIQNGT